MILHSIVAVFDEAAPEWLRDAPFPVIKEVPRSIDNEADKIEVLELQPFPTSTNSVHGDHATALERYMRELNRVRALEIIRFVALSTNCHSEFQRTHYDRLSSAYLNMHFEVRSMTI